MKAWQLLLIGVLLVYVWKLAQQKPEAKTGQRNYWGPIEALFSNTPSSTKAESPADIQKRQQDALEGIG